MGANRPFGPTAVGVVKDKRDLILGVGSQVENAARVLVLPMEDGRRAAALTGRNPPQRHGLAPGTLSHRAIPHRDRAIQVGVAGDLPFDGQIEDRGMRSGDITGDRRVVIGRRHARQHQHNQCHRRHTAHDLPPVIRWPAPTSSARPCDIQVPSGLRSLFRVFTPLAVPSIRQLSKADLLNCDAPASSRTWRPYLQLPSQLD